MRINDNAARNAERVAEHNVCSFARNAAERQKLVHRLRNFAAVFLDDSPARRLNVLRFVTKETRRVNVLFQLSLRDF